jgi:dihydroorotase
MKTPSSIPYDLVIHAGRVICPATGLDGPGAVAVRGDRIAAELDAGESAALSQDSARQTLSFPECVLLPGLVDAHAHPALSGSKYGIDPDVHMLPYGSTTLLSQGDAGANNWQRYKEETIGGSRTRILMALNLSASGESNEEGCFANLEDANVDACVETVLQDPESIWGIAVNVGPGNCRENDPREIMSRAFEAAERTGKPLLIGQRRHDDWSLEEQFDLLRPGDVVTYAFHARAGSPVADGKVLDCVWAARERGILFDLGHGNESFSLDVTTTAISEGFLPDTISTDIYERHLNSSPRHHLPLVMSKLQAAGMQEADIWPRVTSRPAALLGLEHEIGALRPGMCADLAVLRWHDEPQTLKDAVGNEREGGVWEPVLTVRGGEIVTCP